MNVQIYSMIWPYILKCCALKLLWIFGFVIVCISGFVMIMFKSRREDLRKSVLSKNSVETIHGKISDLKQGIKLKESKPTGWSGKKMRKVLKSKTAASNKSSSLRNLQRTLISNLKKDVLKTEEELAELEREIITLSKRRESIKYEISKQSDEYKKCMQIFIKD